jgi:cell division protein FtsW
MSRLNRGWRSRPDLSLLMIVIILTVFGFFMILSASAPMAVSTSGDTLVFVRKQAVWAVIGLLAMGLGMVLSLDRLRALTKPILAGSALLLIATHLPGMGHTVYGATRWLKLGPFSVQPSELAKIALVLFVADFLARHPQKGWGLLKEQRQLLLPIGGMLGLVLFQPDLGSTLMLALSCYVLFLVNGTAVWKMASLALVGSVAVFLYSWNTEYQRLRWLALLDPWKYPKDIGFQTIQSLLAIGSGGIFGMGYGQGKQKLFYLPIQHSDFIFAVIAEEWGLLGAVGTVLLFLALAQRGFAIATRATNPFHQLLAVGITTMITAQAFINIGVVIGVLPTTGIPLPFLSSGGTSLLVTLFGVGLILNVSRQSQAQLRLLRRGEASA